MMQTRLLTNTHNPSSRPAIKAELNERGAQSHTVSGLQTNLPVASPIRAQAT